MSRKVAVVFYQPEDTDAPVSSVPEPYVTDDVITRKAKGRIPASKSLDSEDSGVKSASVSNDDDEAPKSRAKGRRKSRVSLASVPSTPLFDFPSFDELFETMGQAKLKIHRIPTFKQPLTTSSVIESSEKQGFIEMSEEISLNAEDARSKREKFQRQDSMMTHSMTSLINSYAHASNGIREFSQRVGNAVHHKYFMRCRVESTVFTFAYVVFGIFLVCTGLICFLDCQQEILVFCYMLVDGLLSVFVFPILIMDWSKRIGGCIPANEEVDSGTFWRSVLLIRTLFVISGTVIVIYRHEYDLRPLGARACRVEFFVLVSSVVLEWMVLVVVIFLPLCVYACVYYYVRTRSSTHV